MEGEAGLPGKLYFRIGEVAELVGVEPHVLRYWETEFRMRPHRSSSGHRLYRKKDIQRFLRIRKLLHTEPLSQHEPCTLPMVRLSSALQRRLPPVAG